jgi:hypothetical protein
MFANVFILTGIDLGLFYLGFIIIWAAIFIDFSIIEHFREGSIEVRIKEAPKKGTF